MLRLYGRLVHKRKLDHSINWSYSSQVLLSSSSTCLSRQAIHKSKGIELDLNDSHTQYWEIRELTCHGFGSSPARATTVQRQFWAGLGMCFRRKGRYTWKRISKDKIILNNEVLFTMSQVPIHSRKFSKCRPENLQNIRDVRCLHAAKQKYFFWKRESLGLSTLWNLIEHS